MQHRGGAIGHKTMQKETKSILKDRDKLDEIPFVLESEQEQSFYRGSEDLDVEMDRRDMDDGEDEDRERGDNENNDNMEGYSMDEGEVRGESGNGLIQKATRARTTKPIVMVTQIW